MMTKFFAGFVVALIASPFAVSAQTAIYCPYLSVSMEKGARDSTTDGQVSELQRFLADYYHLNYSDYVTGFFGNLTHSNVVRFQNEKGLPSYGYVGAMTRAAVAQACKGVSGPYGQAAYSGGTSNAQGSYNAYSQANDTYAQSGYVPTDGSCRTPWGTTIANGSSTAAYQVLTSCQFEMRTCTSGVLSGSFQSRSCLDSSSYAQTTYYAQAGYTTIGAGKASGLKMSAWLGPAPFTVKFELTSSQQAGMDFGDGSPKVFPQQFTNIDGLLYGTAEHTYTSQGSFLVKMFSAGGNVTLASATVIVSGTNGTGTTTNNGARSIVLTDPSSAGMTVPYGSTLTIAWYSLNAPTNGRVNIDIVYPSGSVRRLITNQPVTGSYLKAMVSEGNYPLVSGSYKVRVTLYNTSPVEDNLASAENPFTVTNAPTSMLEHSQFANVLSALESMLRALAKLMSR